MLIGNMVYFVFARAVEKECCAPMALIVIKKHVPYARSPWCVIGNMNRIDKENPGGLLPKNLMALPARMKRFNESPGQC